MSRCYTLNSTGLSNGIVVDRSSTPGWPDSIDVGRSYHYDFHEDWCTLRPDWCTLPLDRNRPPTIVDCLDGTSRIVKASVIEVGDRQFIRAEYPHQDQALVHIDTGHTQPCLDGGYWSVRTGNPSEVMRGRQGQHVYSVYHRGGSLGYIDPLDEPSEEVDERAAWDIGVLLLAPGDSVEVHFKAPGKVIGLLTCIRAGDLRFELTSNEVDEGYEWEPVDYQEERDAADDWSAYERSRRDLFEYDF